MKLAVAGDIHSNSPAFTAFCHEIEREKVDGVILTGDYVSDCAYPARTIELIKKLRRTFPCYLVRGNRESYLLKHHHNPDDGWCYDSHSGSLLYTYETLSPNDLDFLFTLPETLEVSLPGCDPIFLFHGSPTSATEQLYPEHENTNVYLAENKYKFMICGHSHQQFIYEHSATQLLNPGSLGIPVQGSTKAQYAIIKWQDSGWQATLKELTYDNMQTICEISESGLEEKALYWAKCINKTLQTGNSYIPNCFMLAQKLAEADNTKCSGLAENRKETDKLVFNPKCIPLMYWKAAAKQLGIE